LTIFAWNAFSFGWFGLPNFGFFTTHGANELAAVKVETVAVPLAAQLCAMKFNAQPAATVAEKVERLREASYTYRRSQELDPKWVTLHGAKEVNDAIVDSCAKLILAGHPEKSANLQK
jgi:hypothetical protein